MIDGRGPACCPAERAPRRANGRPATIVTLISIRRRLDRAGTGVACEQSPRSREKGQQRELPAAVRAHPPPSLHLTASKPAVLTEMDNAGRLPRKLAPSCRKAPTIKRERRLLSRRTAIPTATCLLPHGSAPEPALLILRRIDFEARHGRRRPAPEKSHRSDPINQGSAPCAGPAYGRSPAIYSCKTSPQADFSVVRQRAGSPRKSSPLLFEYKNNIYINGLQNTPDTMVEIFYSRTFSPFASGSTLIVSTSPPENSHLYQKASAPTVLVPQYPRGFAAR